MKIKTRDQWAYAALNETCGQDGMNKLEYFAAAALSVAFARLVRECPESRILTVSDVAREAFEIAEDMCAESDKRKDKK